MDLQNTGEFEAGCNAAWLNIRHQGIPGVKRNAGRVARCRDFFFSKPKKIPFPVNVAVPSWDFDVLAHKGALTASMPEELLDALWLAIHRDLDKDESVKQKWLTVLLTATFIFKVMDNDAMFYDAINQRETFKEASDDLSSTGRDRIMQLSVMWGKASDRLGSGSCGDDKIELEFNLHVKLAHSSEPVTANFIKQAKKVAPCFNDNVMINPIIDELETMFATASPLNTVSNLYALVNKAKTDTLQKWVFASLHDVVMMKYHHVSDFTERSLTGHGLGGKGYVDLWIFKFECLDWLIQSVLDKLEYADTELKINIKTTYASHASVRKHVEHYPNTKAMV